MLEARRWIWLICFWFWSKEGWWHLFCLCSSKHRSHQLCHYCFWVFSFPCVFIKSIKCQGEYQKTVTIQYMALTTKLRFSSCQIFLLRNICLFLSMLSSWKRDDKWEVRAPGQATKGLPTDRQRQFLSLPAWFFPCL